MLNTCFITWYFIWKLLHKIYKFNEGILGNYYYTAYLIFFVYSCVKIELDVFNNKQLLETYNLNEIQNQISNSIHPEQC